MKKTIFLILFTINCAQTVSTTSRILNDENTKMLIQFAKDKELADRIYGNRTGETSSNDNSVGNWNNEGQTNYNSENPYK
jgi:hypothetical protein